MKNQKIKMDFYIKGENMEIFEEKLEKEILKIEDAFKDFFLKYNMILMKKSRDGVTYKNKKFDFLFNYGEYYHNHYEPIQFEGLTIKLKNKSYGLDDVINFIYIEKEQGGQYGLDTHTLLKTWEDYVKNLEKYFIPFSQMEDNIQQMEAYLDKSCPWREKYTK